MVQHISGDDLLLGNFTGSGQRPTYPTSKIGWDERTNHPDLALLEERCAWCGERLYTIVRGHHHTENGKDVTK